MAATDEQHDSEGRDSPDRVSPFAPPEAEPLRELMGASQEPGRPARAGLGHLLSSVPLRFIATTLGIVVPIVVALWLTTLNGDPATPPTAAASINGLVGVESVGRTLEGVPEKGNRLGSATAPVRLIEYADLACASCARFHEDILPGLLRRYIRTRQVQLEVRLVRVNGADDADDAGTTQPADNIAASASDPTLQAAMGVAAEDKLFEFLGVLYRNLDVSTEAGEPTRALQLRVLGAMDGLSSEARRGLAFSERGTAELRSYADSAERQQVETLPTFFLARTGVPSARLGDGEEQDLTSRDLTDAIERALAGT